MSNLTNLLANNDTQKKINLSFDELCIISVAVYQITHLKMAPPTNAKIAHILGTDDLSKITRLQDIICRTIKYISLDYQYYHQA